MNLLRYITVGFVTTTTFHLQAEYYCYAFLSLFKNHLIRSQFLWILHCWHLSSNTKTCCCRGQYYLLSKLGHNLDLPALAPGSSTTSFSESGQSLCYKLLVAPLQNILHVIADFCSKRNYKYVMLCSAQTGTPVGLDFSPALQNGWMKTCLRHRAGTSYCSDPHPAAHRGGGRLCGSFQQVSTELVVQRR